MCSVNNLRICPSILYAPSENNASGGGITSLAPRFIILTFILVINVKVPTIVGTETLISRINAAPESFKAICFFTFQLLWQVEISCSAELDFIQPQAKARLVIHLSLTSLCLFCYAMAEYGIFRRYEPSLKKYHCDF